MYSVSSVTPMDIERGPVRRSIRLVSRSILKEKNERKHRAEEILRELKKKKQISRSTVSYETGADFVKNLYFFDFYYIFLYYDYLMRQFTTLQSPNSILNNADEDELRVLRINFYVNNTLKVLESLKTKMTIMREYYMTHVNDVFRYMEYSYSILKARPTTPPATAPSDEVIYNLFIYLKNTFYIPNYVSLMNRIQFNYDDVASTCEDKRCESYVSSCEISQIKHAVFEAYKDTHDQMKIAQSDLETIIKLVEKYRFLENFLKRQIRKKNTSADDDTRFTKLYDIEIKNLLKSLGFELNNEIPLVFTNILSKDEIKKYFTTILKDIFNLFAKAKTTKADMVNNDLTKKADMVNNDLRKIIKKLDVSIKDNANYMKIDDDIKTECNIKTMITKSQLKGIINDFKKQFFAQKSVIEDPILFTGHLFYDFINKGIAANNTFSVSLHEIKPFRTRKRRTVKFSTDMNECYRILSELQLQLHYLYHIEKYDEVFSVKRKSGKRGSNADELYPALRIARISGGSFFKQHTKAAASKTKYEKRTVDELRELCKSRNIKYSSKFKKGDFIKALRNRYLKD